MRATASSRVSKTPGVCGGDACITGTRIPVCVLVNYGRLRGSKAGLLDAYPSLTAADLEAAWEYAATHLHEISRTIRENEEGEEGFVE